MLSRSSFGDDNDAGSSVIAGTTPMSLELDPDEDEAELAGVNKRPQMKTDLLPAVA
jgi:hypothetical protein